MQVRVVLKYAQPKTHGFGGRGVIACCAVDFIEESVNLRVTVRKITPDKFQVLTRLGPFFIVTGHFSEAEVRLKIVGITGEAILHCCAGFIQFSRPQEHFPELRIALRRRAGIRHNQSPLEVYRFRPILCIRREFFEGFESPEIFGVLLQYAR